MIALLRSQTRNKGVGKGGEGWSVVWALDVDAENDRHRVVSSCGAIRLTRLRLHVLRPGGCYKAEAECEKGLAGIYICKWGTKIKGDGGKGGR